jgi:hypothetical protein
MGLLGSSFSSVRKTITDFFERANQSGLGNTDDGSRWNIIRPGFNVVNGKAEGTGANYPMAVLNTSTEDVSISLYDISNGSSAALWVSDLDNWWAIGIEQEPVSCNCETGFKCTTYNVNSRTEYCSGNLYNQWVCATSTPVSSTQVFSNTYNSGQPCVGWRNVDSGVCQNFAWNTSYCQRYVPGNCFQWGGGFARFYNAFTCTAYNAPGCQVYYGSGCAAYNSAFCSTWNSGNIIRNATRCSRWFRGVCNGWTGGFFVGYNSRFCRSYSNGFCRSYYPSGCDVPRPTTCRAWGGNNIATRNATFCAASNGSSCQSFNGVNQFCTANRIDQQCTTWTQQTRVFTDTNPANSAWNAAYNICTSYNSNSGTCAAFLYNAESCQQFTPFEFNCQTCYPQYIRLMQSSAGIVTEIFKWAVTTTIKSLKIKTKGDELTISSYSDANLTSQIGTDIVYTPTGVTVNPRHGITIQPSVYEQAYTVGGITIERN